MDVNADGHFNSGDDTPIGKHLLLVAKSLRPEQYYKNLLLFAGVIFSYRIFDPHAWASAVAAFIIYCMLSGSCYVVNDIMDVKKDKFHPVKSKRPIASGGLGIPAAVVLATALMAISLAMSYFVSQGLFFVSLCFILSNVLYNLLTNSIPLLDAVSISVNFILRVIAGCLTIGTAIPLWITVCVFILALLLVFGKRRSELALFGDRARQYRRLLFTAYSIKRLDILMGIASLALLASYALYVYDSGSIYIILTVPLVIYGILRYYSVIRSRNVEEVSDLLMSDKWFVACMAAWIFLIIIAYTAK